MLDITHYLLAHPMIGLGLAILVVLCGYNVVRRQPRIAMGLWLVILAVLFYVHVQAADELANYPEEDLVAPPEQTR